MSQRFLTTIRRHPGLLVAGGLQLLVSVPACAGLGAIRVEPEAARESEARAEIPVAPRNAAKKSSHFALPPIDMVNTLAGSDRQKTGVPLQIGVSRSVEGLRSLQDMHNALAWESLAEGGQVAALSIDAGNARALRLGLRVFSLPAEARLRLVDETDATVFETDGQAILATLASNAAAGEVGEATHTWWSPVVRGASLRLELELPPGQSPDAVRLALPAISHIDVAPETLNSIGKSLACNNDISCDADWSTISKATTHMVFTESGGTYICTGTLLNDTDAATQIPYVLSANHCISNQTVASTLQTYWFFTSSGCNSGSVAGSYRVLSGGADYLYSDTQTDVSLLRLKSTPPSGAVFAGWQAGLPATGSSVAGVHHPSGDLQKISYGSVTGYAYCYDGSDENFYCESASATAADHLIVRWSSGTTEGGSSGSGLFNSGKYLVGTLHGGTSTKTCNGDQSYYGRFDLAYQKKLHEYLSAKTQTSYELLVTIAGTGTGTVTGLGIQCGADCSETYTAGTQVTLTQTPGADSAFDGWEGACSGTGASCTVTMDAARNVTARYSSKAQISLRDAFYQYSQPINANAYKALMGINCDVFQLVLDVKTGYTDLAFKESSTTYYPDRILGSAPMFAYSLYGNSSSTKSFILWDNNVVPESQIGTATFFGYCFSSNPGAMVIYYDDASKTCQRSNGTTVSCGTYFSAGEKEQKLVSPTRASVRIE